MKGILSHNYVAYPIALGLVALGLVTFIYILWTIYLSYRNAKKTGKPTSWLKLSDDILWTMYCWDVRDKEYVMSLPRLIYFISSILIVYVVITDKTSMLTPLLGFNLSAMISYTSKRYIEGKEDKEALDRENALQAKLDEINQYSQNWSVDFSNIPSGENCDAGSELEAPNTEAEEVEQ